MGINPVKITENKSQEIQNQIRQKSQEAAGKTVAVNPDSTQKPPETTSDNELYFLGDTTGFKTYRFNGRLNQGEEHLGSNFDMVV